MLNKKILLLFTVFLLISNCSFDSKTGIWGDQKKERERISDIEKNQKGIIKTEKIYSSNEQFNQQVTLNKNIILSKPKKNSLWKMSNFNYQNYMGNLYLQGSDNVLLKKKVGKDKFSLHGEISQLLVFNNTIIFSDDRGTIYKINESGRVIWKKNIYKKAYKRIYKNLVFSIYKNNIYVADNIGLVYSIDLSDGKLIWIKNHEVPIKSSIKVFDDKIFLIDQDNKIFSLNSNDGSLMWNILSISSFIKSGKLLSLALTKDGFLLAITSSADLYKVKAKSGEIFWSRNTGDTLYAYETDFFDSSQMVVSDNDVIFSSGSNTFSLNLENGDTVWKNKVSSVSTPIVSGKNIFIVTNNGYFVILEKKTGKIISSQNILKILKRKKQNTKISNFIMGSKKIYITTLNGFLIEASATTGKAESFKKIGGSTISPLVISNGKLYILTNESKILVLN